MMKGPESLLSIIVYLDVRIRMKYSLLGTELLLFSTSIA